MKRRDKEAGRSIEEVILRRKMGDEPHGFPPSKQANLGTSQSLPQLIKPNPAQAHMMSLTSPATMQLTERDRASSVPGKAPPIGIPQPYTGRSYTEDEVRKMMEEVMRFSKSLQHRVQDLETQLIYLSRNKNGPSAGVGPLASAGFAGMFGGMDPATTSGGRVTFSNTATGSRSAGGMLATDGLAEFSESFNSTANNSVSTRSQRLRSLSEASRPTTTGVSADMISDIDNKLSTLKEIFRKNDPMEERKIKAMKIQAVIRGFLARCRFKSFRSSQRDWRWMRCRPVIWLLDILLANQSKLDSGLNLLRMNRTMKWMHTVFSKWANIYRQNAPMRRMMKRAANEKIKETKRKFLKAAFDGFKAATIGKLSTKNANKERKIMIDDIRAEISKELREKGLLGIVPEDEISRTLHKRVIEEFNRRKRLLVLKSKFAGCKKLVVMARNYERMSRKHHFKVLAGRCFYAWSDYTYLKAQGLDRKRWPGPRKYEVRYNQKRVDHFSKMRCKRMIFLAWKAYFAIQYKVKRSYQRKISLFLNGIFQEWKSVSNHYRRLRRLTYENWTGYARIMVSTPFQAWADYVRGVKNKFNEHIRIAKAYRRWKMRQKIGQIMKVWRHQALFGRLDGLYSRQMLLKSLGEQKIFTNSLEKLMSDQTIELEECRQVVSLEIEKRKELESEITKLQGEIQGKAMTNHHYEQELKRLESVVESMLKINPKQMDHLINLHGPEFRFKERQIATGTGDKKGLAGGGDDEDKDEDDEDGGGEEGGESGKVAGGGLGSITEEDGVPEDSNKLTPAAGDDDTSSLGGGSVSGGKGAPPPNNNVVPSSGLSGGTSLVGGDSVVGGKVGPKPVMVDQATMTTESGETNTGGAGGDAKGDKGMIAVDSDDQKLLERARWLVERYRQTLADIPVEEEEDDDDDESIGKKGLGESAAEGDSDDDEDDDDESFDDLSGSLAPPVVPPAPGSSGKQKKRKRNDLLRHVNPFIKSKSMSFSNKGMLSTMSKDDLRPDAILRVPSTGGIKNPYRSSFSRTASFAGGIGGSTSGGSNGLQALGASILENSVTFPANSGGGDGAPQGYYYNDEELEDTVITWAKMLFTFLEFLDTGDVTNLPADDKRKWVEHLLDAPSTPANEVPAMADWDVPPGPGSGNNSIESALYQALQTVDERMHGGVSWKEALLRLRTMFPSAGNFSGFGLGVDTPQDAALFRRLLHMREELKKVEDIQTHRYQRQFLERQREREREQEAMSAKKKSRKGGALKNLFSIQHATTLSQEDAAQADPSLLIGAEGDGVIGEGAGPIGTWDEGDSRPYTPLGLNIYAGNLSKLREQSQEDLLPKAPSVVSGMSFDDDE